MHVDISVVGGLALPLLAAHLIADHPLQPSSWAAAKGSCDHAGRVACAKHVAVVVGLQALAVLAVVGLTGVAVSPLAVVAGLSLTAWSHYWADRRYTLAGLYEVLGRTEFARLGTPRPGRDDNPSLGTGAYRMDQDWHHLWLAISALVIAAPAGPVLAVLTTATAVLMAASITASRWGRRTQHRTAETTTA
ncbi:DUF3307 domain-containing protein [Klebsiella pneumoniae]|nr:DUF3307 domain-containing protein [Klebsiella pneumoniae]